MPCSRHPSGPQCHAPGTHRDRGAMLRAPIGNAVPCSGHPLGTWCQSVMELALVEEEASSSAHIQHPVWTRLCPPCRSTLCELITCFFCHDVPFKTTSTLENIFNLAPALWHSRLSLPTVPASHGVAGLSSACSTSNLVPY